MQQQWALFSTNLMLIKKGIPDNLLSRGQPLKIQSAWGSKIIPAGAAGVHAFHRPMNEDLGWTVATKVETEGSESEIFLSKDS